MEATFHINHITPHHARCMSETHIVISPHTSTTVTVTHINSQ
jgi:hypothetical protein